MVLDSNVKLIIHKNVVGGILENYVFCMGRSECQNNITYNISQFKYCYLN
jgi:hypothetical protein